MNQLGDFGSLLRGVPVRPEQTISTFQQQPGLFQTALGAGLTGLGLYRGYGGERLSILGKDNEYEAKIYRTEHFY